MSMPELTVDAFPLDSVPLPHASGLVPEANQAFVAQQHPEGRITFIDWTAKSSTPSPASSCRRRWDNEAVDLGLGLAGAALLGALCLQLRRTGRLTPRRSGLSGNSGGTLLGVRPEVAVNAAGGTAPDRNGWRAAAADLVVVPPEKELEQSFLAPVVTGKFVFSANPKSGRVAVIDAETYAVRLFNAGFGPKYLAAIAERSRRHRDQRAVARHDAVSSCRTTRSRWRTRALPVHDDANAWAVSPDGRFAIAWTRTDADAEARPDGRLADHHRARPRAARPATRSRSAFIRPKSWWTQASERAFVVSDDGVSVVELGDDAGGVAARRRLRRSAGGAGRARREHLAGRLLRGRAHRGQQPSCASST